MVAEFRYDFTVAYKTLIKYDMYMNLRADGRDEPTTAELGAQKEILLPPCLFDLFEYWSNNAETWDCSHNKRLF